MENMCYSSRDIAIIISSMNFGCQKESAYIDLIWNEEKPFILPQYYQNKIKFILDVRYWLNYIYEKPTIDAEFPAIQKDLEHLKGTLKEEYYMSDFADLDLFFKNIRIRILYNGQKDYARIKLRTLLNHYGYKRRSHSLICHINNCLCFYHLNITLRGGIPCSIAEVGLDQMITFRVVQCHTDISKSF